MKINDAYMQRNQFGAVHFVYKNEIYFFGGYGLFTTKNILTKYIFKTKDWIQVQTRGEKVQEPRHGAYSYINGEYLYVFGGGAKDENNIPFDKLLDNTVWRLHLPTMQWECEGTYDQKAINILPDYLIKGSNKIYLCQNNFLEIDYRANKLNTYESNCFSTLLSSYLEGNKLIGVYGVASKKFFHVGEISEFKGKLRSTAVYITPPVDYTYYMATASFSLMVLIVFFYVFRKPLKSVVKPFKGIVYDQSKQAFEYKGKPIVIFEDQDKKVLFYLLDHLDQYVSLNELNQLFENSEIVETISATVKRREQCINGLLTKVSKITGIDEKELILERKNTDDKRIKDILLLPNLLKKE